MPQQLTLQTAVETIRGAFKPLVCGVEVFDYEQKVRFRVFAQDGKPVLTMEEMKASRAQDPTVLKDALDHARSRVEAKGFVLAPWTFATD